VSDLLSRGALGPRYRGVPRRKSKIATPPPTHTGCAGERRLRKYSESIAGDKIFAVARGCPASIENERVKCKSDASGGKSELEYEGCHMGV
jgi:hypothetical protein